MIDGPEKEHAYNLRLWKLEQTAFVVKNNSSKRVRVKTILFLQMGEIGLVL
jgi:hypothetical protein